MEIREQTIASNYSKIFKVEKKKIIYQEELRLIE